MTCCEPDWLDLYLTHKLPSQVIKFLAPHSTPIPSQPVPITAADRSTLSLLASVASLSASISSLEDRITAARNKAAGYAAQKRVELAKAALVEKRRDEKLLEERVGQRLKVQEVVSAIERAVGDEEVSFAGSFSLLSSGVSSSWTGCLWRRPPRCEVGITMLITLFTDPLCADPLGSHARHLDPPYGALFPYAPTRQHQRAHLCARSTLR